MAAVAGRDVKLFKDSVLFVAGRTKSFTFNREAIDITTDDDNGFRTLLAKPGVKSLDIEVQGVLKNADFLELVNEDDEASVNTIEIEFPGIGTVSGDFYTATVGASANHDDAVEQTISLQSTGTFAFTPEST